VNEANKVCIAARVEPELAAEVVRLAAAGDRSVSREIRRAIAEHVARQDPGASPPPRPENPAASRLVPEEITPAVEARRQRAGEAGA
jgi:hypothetical protein